MIPLYRIDAIYIIMHHSSRGAPAGRILHLRIALGPRAGRKVLSLQYAPSRATTIGRDLAKWAKVVKDSGARVD